MVPALFWMGKWLYGRPRPIMDERLAPDFVRQMGRRYGIATLLTVAAVPLALVAPRVAVALSLSVLLYFALPQPRPRYRPGLEPDETTVTAD